MDTSLKTLLTLARDTVAAPREGARAIMALRLPVQIGWMALALMAVGSTVLTHLSFALLPADSQDFMTQAMNSPLRTAVLQGLVMVVSVHLMYRLGRAFGGIGGLADALVLVAWLQFILLIVQAAQLVLQVILPPFASLLGLVGVALFFWLLTNFVLELHGFRSLFKTFGAVVLTLLALGLVMSIVLAAVLGQSLGGA